MNLIKRLSNLFIHNSLNKYFDEIFVISLKEETENRKLISKYFSRYHIDFTFVDAVNGFKDISIIQHYRKYMGWPYNLNVVHPLEQKYRKKLIKSPGALGLLKTYENIITYCLNNNHENILIFEDDVLFDKQIIQKYSDVYKTLKNNYDLIYLGASHHVWNDPTFFDSKNQFTKIYKAPYTIDGSFAVAYNRKIFTELLDVIKKKNAPFDVCLRSIVDKNNSYIVYPNICVAETTKVSKISKTSRNLRSHKFNVRWDLSNIDFSRGSIKVSIIMANYNNSKTIIDSLNSVKKQTYQNFEIIVVDDVSTDNSTKKIKKWINENKNINIKLIELSNNVGAYVCRNIALEESSGFFITLLDPDDIFLSQKLEKDVEHYFNNHDCEVLLSRMYRANNINYNLFNNETLLLKAIDEERDKNKTIKNDSAYYSWPYQFRLGMPTIFLEKSFFDRYGKWRDDYRYGMDIELIQRYIAKKFHEFISHKDLFTKTHNYQTRNYGILSSKYMQYVSFPMNNNNATNICINQDRENIHKQANQDIQRMINESQTFNNYSVQR